MHDEAEFLAAEAAFKPRSRAPLVIAVVVALLIGGVAGAGAITLLGGATPRSKKAAQAPAACPSATPASSASASLPAPARTDSLAERASSGEANAVRELESRAVEERTSEEATALAAARALAKKKEIGELKRKIVLVPRLLEEDKETLGRVKELINDREVASELMGMLISLPGTAGTDLLYSLYAGMKSKSENARLAEELLYSKDIRKSVSPALSVVLDLRKAEKCEDASSILQRIKEHGDRRSLAPMARLSNKKGCGEKKTDDCFKCLRSSDLLKEAQAQAAKRSTP